MITRQRLGQLIKEEKFIYTTRLGGKKPEKFKLYKDFFMSQKDTLCCLNKSHEFLVCEVKFKYLFETKEEAEFALKPKPILDKEEKEYLEAVLKPFKDRTESIAKFCVDNESGIQFISIWIKSIFVGWDFERIDLPYFDKDMMYKDLELGKEYTLKELGLFED